jgi:hypothetical protein
VAPYVAPAKPKADETLVYVFRAYSYVGSARDIAVIDNDTYVAVLPNDAFSYFTIKGDGNAIVSEMAPNRKFLKFNNRMGQTVYLFISMSMSGMVMDEIDEQKATELISKFKFVESVVGNNLKAKVNYKTYYDDLYKK